jgi:hypothetical protein
MKDLLTSEEFQPRRLNQKFARKENRIKFNNNKANKLRHHLKSINNPLLNNFRILRALLNEDREKIFHRQFLLGRSYDFSKTTHLAHWENKTYYALYDYILIQLDNDMVKIINQSSKI